ncbi:probable xyloglucan galactosyltransferase GT12 [Mangifera indica]|uniref:probable xyloglucan galactosyltransferase GT12 n=1 Tax=Mangifera indica TaxID=29780 RepID=UPI001CFBC59A|nr:probable xyloglucan galactosyltransferase GT12 [Mangifera indica]
MEKQIVEKCRKRLWLVILFSIVFSLVLFFLGDFAVISEKIGSTDLVINFGNSMSSQLATGNVTRFVNNETNHDPWSKEEIMKNISHHVADSCIGQYIYIHDLPSQFNVDILKNCRKLNKWFDMCPLIRNSGLGPRVKNQKGILQKNGWYSTNQFMLEVIFHNRMKQYKCLTSNSSLASAIYVPFYAGLDVGRYLWDYNSTVKDSLAIEMAKWVAAKPEWKRMWGRDHFFVAGRVAWDFRRENDANSDWGSKLMCLPESMNMTILTIETTSWSNEFAIPYPTYFHPSSESKVLQWQNKVRNTKRNYLFSFVGAPRPYNDSIRGEIISQCLASRRLCKLLDCSSDYKVCDNPVEVMKVFQDSVFCLQPPGDSPTRRSTFDSILAGCIPVFFHPGSAYAQYIWYLPKNYTKYSVFIPENGPRDRRESINDTLLKFTKEEILSMRNEVIGLIPKIVYGDPWGSKNKEFEDAFSIAVRGVLKRVEEVTKKMKDGKDPSIGFAEENSWKLKLSGTFEEHNLLQFC